MLEKSLPADANSSNDTNLRRRQELRLLRSLGVTFLHFRTSKGFLLYKNIKKVDVTNLYRFPHPIRPHLRPGLRWRPFFYHYPEVVFKL